MLKRISKSTLILIAILAIAASLRLFRLDFPNEYVFDEVYHGFTATEYVKNNPEAWEYWATPPEGVAFEWTHPPFAKEVMAMSLSLFNNDAAWAYRLPGVVFNLIGIFLVYLIGKKLFASERIGLFSAFLFSIDGLNFVQSRVAMNDSYFVTLTLATLLALHYKKYFITAVLLGLTVATKWTGFYLIGMVLIIIFFDQFYPVIKNILSEKRTIILKPFLLLLNILKQIFRSPIPYLIYISPLVYLITYLPFFTTGHNFQELVDTQKQMWWYHTGLNATHDYTSPWWSWPFNLYPVWYYVKYFEPNIVINGSSVPGVIANIFATGNPIIFWSGFATVLVSVWQVLEKKNRGLLILLLGFLIFWLPWAFSPRIMFLYHYSPSVPFLCLILAYQLNLILEEDKKTKGIKTLKQLLSTINGKFVAGFLLLSFVSFLVLYPYMTGIPLPRDKALLFFSTNLTKNPFGSR